MIPAYIEQSHILKAIEKINTEDVPTEYESTKFDLLYGGKTYPPKYVISLAHTFVNGEKWTRDKFSGGDETNKFLISRGFSIIEKNKHFLQYWLPAQVKKDSAFGGNLIHSGSNQYQNRNVKAGDVVWIVTVKADGQLYLVGKMSVESVVSYSEALNMFTDDVFDKSFHIVTKEENSEPFKNISLMDVVDKLRFHSEQNDRLKIVNNRIDAKQLQTIRQLTSGSINLIEEKWKNENILSQSTIPENATKPLKLYEDYTREDVQKIFAPNDKFIRSAGTWGILGIISIPNRTDDFVFFVTYGQKQGEHTFDEGITEDGILSWQSQPSKKLNSSRIRRIINHDELKNTIYIFLRTKKGLPYTYLGTLRYLSHDTEREKPVYFQGQIIEGSIPEEVCERIGLKLQISTENNQPEIEQTKQGVLILTDPPAHKLQNIVTTNKFRARKVKDYSIIDAKNRKLGLAGELLVLDFERKSLIENGRDDLAKKVRHVSQIEGDGAGYDIESYTPEGNIKYIEVKTTKGNAKSAFFISSNEVNFFNQKPDNYHLYRVFEYEFINNSGKFFVITGLATERLNLIPTQFRANYIEKSNSS